MIFAIICLLVGMVLGQRFKVLVLVPVIVLVVTLSIAVDLMRADAFWLIALMAVLATVSLQIGYLLGTGIRSFLVCGRATPADATSLGVSSPTRRTAH